MHVRSHKIKLEASFTCHLHKKQKHTKLVVDIIWPPSKEKKNKGHQAFSERVLVATTFSELELVTKTVWATAWEASRSCSCFEAWHRRRFLGCKDIMFFVQWMGFHIFCFFYFFDSVKNIVVWCFFYICLVFKRIASFFIWFFFVIYGKSRKEVTAAALYVKAKRLSKNKEIEFGPEVDGIFWNQANSRQISKKWAIHGRWMNMEDPQIFQKYQKQMPETHPNKCSLFTS